MTARLLRSIEIITVCLFGTACSDAMLPTAPRPTTAPVVAELSARTPHVSVDSPSGPPYCASPDGRCVDDAAHSSDRIVIIDGVPMENDGATSAVVLACLKPEDITGVEILRGSCGRAGARAVLITTTRSAAIRCGLESPE